MFCTDKYRTELNTDDYWFGLYKLTATAAGTTEWYDGNPSTYRNWAGGEPNEATICIRYTEDGFKDRPCDQEFYYTCKKPAGNFHVNYLLRQRVSVYHFLFTKINNFAKK